MAKSIGITLQEMKRIGREFEKNIIPKVKEALEISETEKMLFSNRASSRHFSLFVNRVTHTVDDNNMLHTTIDSIESALFIRAIRETFLKNNEATKLFTEDRVKLGCILLMEIYMMEIQLFYKEFVNKAVPERSIKYKINTVFKGGMNVHDLLYSINFDYYNKEEHLQMLKSLIDNPEFTSYPEEIAYRHLLFNDLYY